MAISFACATSAWVGALAAVAAVIGGFLTVIQARRIFRRNAAYRYVALLETEEFRTVQAVSSAFLGCKEPPPEMTLEEWQKLDRLERERRQWARWEQLLNSWSIEDREKVLTILAFPNQLEDIAGAYNLGLIDRTIVKTHIEYLAEAFWDQAAWWLREMRHNPDENIYQDLAMMLPDIRSRKRPRWHHPRDGRIKRTFI